MIKVFRIVFAQISVFHFHTKMSGLKELLYRIPSLFP